MLALLGTQWILSKYYLRIILLLIVLSSVSEHQVQKD